jgi:hypothetical protein
MIAQDTYEIVKEAWDNPGDFDFFQN